MSTPFPRVLELQTTTSCNAGCLVCPHPDVYGGLPSVRMSLDLYTSILDQCVEHQDGLRVCPYLNAEPFLDPRMPDLIAAVNARLPRAEVEISTNLSVLTARLRQRLIGTHIDDLRLSVFGFEQATHQLLMPGLNYDRVRANLESLAEDRNFRDVAPAISIVMLDHPALSHRELDDARNFCAEVGWKLNYWGVLDRSRNVASMSNDVWLNVVNGCEQRRPEERLHVRADGRVIVCCQDWRDEIVLGDLSVASIEAVWNNESYRQLRSDINGGVPGQAPDLCRRCAIAIPG